MQRRPALVQAVESVGGPRLPSLCAGADPVTQARGNWFSRAHFFALAPGQIIDYNRSRDTFQSLERAVSVWRMRFCQKRSCAAETSPRVEGWVGWRGGGAGWRRLAGEGLDAACLEADFVRAGLTGVGLARADLARAGLAERFEFFFMSAPGWRG